MTVFLKKRRSAIILFGYFHSCNSQTYGLLSLLRRNQGAKRFEYIYIFVYIKIDTYIYVCICMYVFAFSQVMASSLLRRKVSSLGVSGLHGLFFIYLFFFFNEISLLGSREISNRLLGRFDFRLWSLRIMIVNPFKEFVDSRLLGSANFNFSCFQCISQRPKTEKCRFLGVRKKKKKSGRLSVCQRCKLRK